MRRSNYHSRSHNKPQSAKKGLYVEVRNGDFNGALRRFKKKVQESGILQEVKDRKEFVKPSVKRKREKAAAKRRHDRNLKKRKEELGY